MCTISSLTHILGATHTKTVHPNSKTGKAIKVAVRPNFLITKPVPKSENRKDIELVA